MARPPAPPPRRCPGRPPSRVLLVAEGGGRLQCPHCHKLLKGTSLRKHLEDRHTVHLTPYECQTCHRHYRTPNSLQNHCSRYHRRPRSFPRHEAPTTSTLTNGAAPQPQPMHQLPPLPPPLSQPMPQPQPPSQSPQGSVDPHKVISFSDMFH